MQYYHRDFSYRFLFCFLFDTLLRPWMDLLNGAAEEVDDVEIAVGIFEVVVAVVENVEGLDDKVVDVLVVDVVDTESLVATSSVESIQSGKI